MVFFHKLFGSALCELFLAPLAQLAFVRDCKSLCVSCDLWIRAHAQSRPQALRAASAPALKDYLRCSTSWRTLLRLFFGNYPQLPNKFFILVIHRRDTSCVWMVLHACTFLLPCSLIRQYVQIEGDPGVRVPGLALSDHPWAMELAPQPNAHQVMGKAEVWKHRRLLGNEHEHAHGWRCRDREAQVCAGEEGGKLESLMWGRLWRMWLGVRCGEVATGFQEGSVGKPVWHAWLQEQQHIQPSSLT